MARARNLKPGFFTNDLLAEVAPLGRLLFAGLWTLADREGRLLDRPRKIKAELLPYDDADIDALLAALAERGFLARYQADGVQVIQIVNWSKHQQPHVNERASDLPRMDAGAVAPASSSEQHPTSMVQVPEEHPGAHPLTLVPRTDSGLLIPDTGGGEPAAADAAPRAVPKPRIEYPAELTAAFAARSLRAPPVKTAEVEAARRLLKVGTAEQIAACWQDIRAGEYGDAWDQANVGFVMLERNNRFFNWLGRGSTRPTAPRRNGADAAREALRDRNRQARGVP